MAFVGELRIFPWAATPQGWLPCDGREVSIDEHQALFVVIGTIYGGDGQTMFALPDLRGRVPLGTGPGIAAGQTGGEEAHTLSTRELPAHAHVVLASPAAATTAQPNGAVLAGAPIWGPATDPMPLQPATVAATGGGQAHLNMQPYLAMSICIAAQGVLPSGTQ